MKQLSVCLIVIVAIAVAGVVAAETYNKKSVVGTWEFDMRKLMKEQMGSQIPEGMDVDQMLEGMYIRISFAKDGTYKFESKNPMGEDLQEGEWDVVETKENVVTIKSVNAEGEEQVIKLIFEDEDNFEAVMPGPNETEVTMSATRVKKEKQMEKKEG